MKKLEIYARTIEDEAMEQIEQQIQDYLKNNLKIEVYSSDVLNAKAIRIKLKDEVISEDIL